MPKVTHKKKAILEREVRLYAGMGLDEETCMDLIRCTYKTWRFKKFHVIWQKHYNDIFIEASDQVMQKVLAGDKEFVSLVYRHGMEKIRSKEKANAKIVNSLTNNNTPNIGQEIDVVDTDVLPFVESDDDKK